MSGPCPTTVLGILGLPIQYTGGVRDWSHKRQQMGQLSKGLSEPKGSMRKRVSLYWKKK